MKRHNIAESFKTLPITKHRRRFGPRRRNRHEPLHIDSTSSDEANVSVDQPEEVSHEPPQPDECAPIEDDQPAAVDNPFIEMFSHGIEDDQELSPANNAPQAVYG